MSQTLRTNPRRNSREPIARPGFASLYALVLVGLTASAIAVLTTLMARDATRTLAESEQAQLRAILRHGTDTVAPRLSTQPLTPGRETFPLPAALEGFVLSLVTEAASPDPSTPARATLTLKATSPSGAFATQSLHLTRPDPGTPWRLTQTTLHP